MMARIAFIAALLVMPPALMAQSTLTLPRLPISLMDDWDDAKKEEAIQNAPSMPDVNTSRSPVLNNVLNSTQAQPDRVLTEGTGAVLTTPEVRLTSQENQQSRPAPKLSENPFNTTVVVKPGVVEVQPIALNHLNRIEVPFDDPQIRTSSDVGLQIIDRFIYVQASSDSVISLYITTPDEELALSVGLLPQAIPPRDMKLVLGQPSDFTGGIFNAPNPLAKKTETAQPYVESVRAIVADIATGKIPSGYGFQKMVNPNAKDIHHCYLSGFSIIPKQRLDGHLFTITVSEVVNIAGMAVEIDESLCYRQGVVAVAAWPEVVLRPGERTELYLLHKREVFAPSYESNRRPSVLEGDR